MVKRPFSRFNLAATLSFLAATMIWTAIALGTRWLWLVDQTSLHPRLSAGSGPAQIWSAISLVSHPIVVCVGMTIGAVWCWRRRLRHLAWAMLLTGPAAWVLAALLKAHFKRARPVSPLMDVLTYSGFSYPSSHLAVITAAAMMAAISATITRVPRSAALGWRIVGVGVVVVVGLDRWMMNAHWFTDIVGGVLVGATSASLVALLLRVRMMPDRAIWLGRPVPRPIGGLCAVIYNPDRLGDESTFRRHVAGMLAARRWEAPLWLPTTADDPGQDMVATALARGADLVLAAGGDGTIRAICSELADSGVPMGLLPGGTSNLLARNLGVPLDQDSALRLAFEGVPTPIDLVRLVVDGDQAGAQHFAVMGGVGFDAQVMANTTTALKRTIGPAAYVITGAQELAAKPHRVRITVDGAAETRRHASLMVMANVGMIATGVALVPDASPYDGQMELLVGSPGGVTGWARLAGRVLARSSTEGQLDQFAGRRITLRLDEPLPYELDGDTLGTGQRFEAEVIPGALMMMLPAPPVHRGGQHPA